MSCVRRLWNNRQRLSLRLTRTYALLFAAATLCLSLCVYLVSRGYLLGRRQSELQSSAENIVDTYYEEIAEGGDPTNPQLLWEINPDESRALLLILPEGETLSSAGYFDVFAQEIPDSLKHTAQYTQSDGVRLMARERRILLDGEILGTLAVVQRLDREYDFLHMLLLLLRGLNCLGSLLALAIGRATAVRMLEPLNDIIRRTRAIAPDALDERLALPPAQDELRLLTQTLNDLLERVEAAFERQRRFAQDASHELRTPLTVLQGNADLLARWGKEDPQVRDRSIAAIQRQTDYMHRLVESLLFLTRSDHGVQALRIEEIGLPVFLEKLIDERRETDAEHAYRLVQTEDIALRADETLLRQLLLILLDNAAKYTPAGGAIILSAEEDGEDVCLRVQDTGCGVPQEQLQRIFERFYRVDKARARQTGGTGLGLAIASAIVDMHGGDITAENAPDGGLIVTARIPVSK